MDRPGDPALAGYPPHLVPQGDPQLALRPGPRPAVVIFYDNHSRASHLTAARLLPLLVSLKDRIDVVPIDHSGRARPGPAVQALAQQYVNGVPTVVVLPPDRRNPQLFFGRFGSGEVELALEDALRRPAAHSASSGSEASSGSDPADRRPVDWRPALPDQTAPAPSLVAGTLEVHVGRLREKAGDPLVPGYPATLLGRADPRVVLEPGRLPAVIIFYDDTSRASSLQAADFLPVLKRHSAKIDLVLIDVSTRARWNAIERQVVRTHYMSFVPTTVVLTADRAPHKVWIHRISGADLERAIAEASPR